MRIIILLMACLPMTGWANLNSNSAEPTSAPVPLLGSGIFQSSEATEIFTLRQYIGTELIDDDPSAFVSLGRGQEFSARYLSEDEVEIHLLFGDEEMPDRIVVSRAEFERVELEFLGLGDENDLAQNFSIYEDTKEAARIRTPKKRRDSYKGYGGCVAYVCRRVGCSGTVGNGKGMVNYLISKKGWKSVSCKNPRRGDVASWTGGSHGKGHTAIWAGGWCYDQGCHDPGRKYRLRGCARK